MIQVKKLILSHINRKGSRRDDAYIVSINPDTTALIKLYFLS